MDTNLNQALAGHRILELDTSVAACYCGRILRRLGAEVVAGRQIPLDDTRFGPSDAAGITYGCWLDDGKIMTSEADLGPFDIVIGDGKDHAGAVSAVISWFGDRGPYAGWSGTDGLVLALAGLAHGFGPKEGPPTLAHGHTPQIMAGANAANVIIATLLLPRDQRARRIDVNVLESTLCLTETSAVSAIAHPKLVMPRFGVNRFVPTYPASNYRARDGWVGVTCLTPPQWRALCELLDVTDLLSDPDLSTALGRLLHADRVDEHIGPAFARRDAAEWAEEGLLRRIPLVTVPSPSELPTLPHWVDRGAFAPIDRVGSHIQGPTLPFVGTTPDGIVAAATVGGSASRPLAGVRIVDFTMGWAGPQATRALGDLGADVVKIESSTHPDWYRGWDADPGGDPPAREIQPNFNTLNRNKRGIDIDLTIASGLQTAKRLIATADVVVESFAAGVMNKLGLGHAEHRRQRPGVISMSMPAFGSTGALSGIRAYGSTVEQSSGLPFVNGEQEWPPSLQHVAFGDAIAGIYAVTAVLAGLHLQRRVGGVDVDLSQVQCLFEVGADSIIGEQVLGTPLPCTGSGRRLGLSTVVPSSGRDQWLAVVASSNAELNALTAVLGSTDLAEWAKARPAAEAATVLQAARVPAAHVIAPHDLRHDPHLEANEFWERLERPYVGVHALGAPPFRLDHLRPVSRRAAPTLGQHTDEILMELDF